MTFLLILSQKSVRLNVEWVWKKTDVQLYKNSHVLHVCESMKKSVISTFWSMIDNLSSIVYTVW